MSVSHFFRQKRYEPYAAQVAKKRSEDAGLHMEGCQS